MCKRQSKLLGLKTLQEQGQGCRESIAGRKEAAEMGWGYVSMGGFPLRLVCKTPAMLLGLMRKQHVSEQHQQVFESCIPTVQPLSCSPQFVSSMLPRFAFWSLARAVSSHISRAGNREGSLFFLLAAAGAGEMRFFGYPGRRWCRWWVPARSL